MKQTAEIIGELGPFPGIAAIHGLTWDGHRVWFGSDSGLHALDPRSGAILRSFAMPADAGTAFDGRHLFQIAEDRIRKIDPESGEVLATIPAPGGGGDSGMAWAEGSLWIGRYRERTIHQVDPETGKVLRTIASDRFVTGVTWVEGELWHGIWEGEESGLRRIDPDSGAVLDQLDLPGGIGVSGLEAGGADRFFCGGGPSGRVRVVRRPQRAG
ncbi:hypothetical protein ACFOGJ_11745 [Marinibaculum pumilum]|uniref:Glutamine cyclotransferase n=1 Tax=Marinibaculum pumilum TaxID=1766165 RepID=A0ABV7L0E5_9PROT